LLHARPDLLVSHTSPELTWLATRGTGVQYVQYHNSPPFYIGPEANPYMMSRRYRRIFARVRNDVAGYAGLALARDGRGRILIEPELRTALKHRALRDASAVVVPSRRTARELRMLHGIEATVIRGCLPTAAISAPRPAPAAPVVLSVCRLEPVKRVDLLLRAFPIVLAEWPDARLIIAGTGSHAQRLKALASTLGIERSAEFTGYVPDSDVPALYGAARVFAAPAMADFNIAPYEALGAGCKVVWTTEMETDPDIEASGAVFVAAPEVRTFAGALLTALASADAPPVDLSSMTWAARAEKLDALYTGIIAERAA
jgi:hypothetical protein